MVRILLFIGLSGAALGQPAAEKLLLPAPVRVSGIVTDKDGRPLSDVWIQHTDSRVVGNTKTNAQGLFDIETRAPAIVFRKDGFQSKYFRIREGQGITVTLDGAPLHLPACKPAANCTSLTGFSASFCLPKIAGVKISDQDNDVDYGQRRYLVSTPIGTVGIQHAAGPMWGSGLPLDSDVWAARDYVEVSYIDDEGFSIIDARGQDMDGKCWRLLGHVFETASYRNVPEPDTRLLDRVLNGVCIHPNRAKAIQRR